MRFGKVSSLPQLCDLCQLISQKHHLYFKFTFLSFERRPNPYGLLLLSYAYMPRRTQSTKFSFSFHKGWWWILWIRVLFAWYFTREIATNLFLPSNLQIWMCSLMYFGFFNSPVWYDLRFYLYQVPLKSFYNWYF